MVTFLGRAGGDAVGIVDLMAVRKNHKVSKNANLKRGDLFEMFLIQVKGGGAAPPDKADIERLKIVAGHYGARVLLATWKRQKELSFSELDLQNGSWDPVTDVRKLFQ